MLIYPAKGYSVTLPILDASRVPTISITDDAKKIVFTRLGDRLRVAGTAELAGYNLELNALRCDALTLRAVEWFGDAVKSERAECWTGLRPATPSNVPLIGSTRYSNLYVNSGHGTLGWTMAAGSGKRSPRSCRGEGPMSTSLFFDDVCDPPLIRIGAVSTGVGALLTADVDAAVALVAP